MAKTTSSSRTEHHKHSDHLTADDDEQAAGVMRSVKDVASSVADRAQEAYEATTDTIGEFNDDVMKLVKRHPSNALLISFGVGCVVGALLLGGLFGGRR